MESLKLPKLEDIMNLTEQTIALAKEYFHLRTLFDFNMDLIEKIVPEKYFESVMETGKKLVDELILSLTIFD
ncbi:MAG: hypothetical protein ACTSWN_15645 [Promethearchaeota archaeon]